MNPKKDKSNDQDAAPKWEATKYQNLFRYVPSGAIYARFKIKGKVVRESMKTSDIDLARSKFAERLHEEQAMADRRFRGRMTFGEALEVYTKRVQRNPHIRPKTKVYFEERVFAKPGDGTCAVR